MGTVGSLLIALRGACVSKSTWRNREDVLVRRSQSKPTGPSSFSLCICSCVPAAAASRSGSCWTSPAADGGWCCGSWSSPSLVPLFQVQGGNAGCWSSTGWWRSCPWWSRSTARAYESYTAAPLRTRSGKMASLEEEVHTCSFVRRLFYLFPTQTVTSAWDEAPASVCLYLAVHERSWGHTDRADWWRSSRSGTSRPPCAHPLAPTEGFHRSGTHAAWRLLHKTLISSMTINDNRCWHCSVSCCRWRVGGVGPCSLLLVLFKGQLASTSSASHVRLFLPCSLRVQSSRERSKALLVSSPTPLHGGILQVTMIDTLQPQCVFRLEIVSRGAELLLNQTNGVTAAVSFHLDTLVWNLHVGQLWRYDRSYRQDVATRRK